MKKLLALIVLCSILCCGCTSESGLSERGMRLREKIQKGSGCVFLAEVTADFGEESFTLALDCALDSEGKLNFRVISPESIEGISGYITQQQGNLTFDDKVLAFPLLALGELSPVSAPWLICKALKSGYIRACGEDSRGFRLTIDDSFSGENLQVDIWTNDVEMPVYAEIVWQGRRLISVDISNFRIV